MNCHEIVQRFFNRALVKRRALGSHGVRSRLTQPYRLLLGSAVTLASLLLIGRSAYNGLVEKGVDLEQKGRFVEAVAVYQRALRLNPTDAFTHYNLGSALEKQGQLDGAIAAYQKALQLDARYTFAYNNIGFAFEQQGKIDDAIAAYQKAVVFNPHYAFTYTCIGDLLSKQHKFEAATVAYRQAIHADHGMCWLTTTWDWR